MKYRQLGASDLHVSEVSLGSWLTYGVGVDKDKAIACVNKSFDVGINFFDTANVYGRGAAETVMGEALAGRARDSYIIATKVWGPMGGGDRGLSRAQIEKQLDASLKRLRVDVIDLYQCHRYDPDTPLEETMEALTRAVQSGKVRWIGFSEWAPDKIISAFELPQGAHFVSSQPQYSLLYRRPEKEVIPYCRDHGVGQIVWSPLAQGVLTGKYKVGATPSEDTRAGSDAMSSSMSGLLQPHILEAVEKLKPLAREAGCSLAQFALAWVLREPNVSSAIVGASRPEQVVDNAAASGLHIDPALFAQAEAITEGVRPQR
ncbi:MAG: aldo/keto reductase family protein [Caulobacterales bacterium]